MPHAGRVNPGRRPGRLSGPLSLSALQTVQVEGASQTEPPFAPGDTCRALTAVTRARGDRGGAGRGGGDTGGLLRHRSASGTPQAVRSAAGWFGLHNVARRRPVLSSESLARRQSSDGRNWLPAGRPRCAGRGGRGATSASRQRGAGTEHGARPCGGGGRRAAWAPALVAGAVPLNQTEPGPVASQDPSGCRGSAGENRDQSRRLEPFLGGERDAAQSLVPGAAAHGRSALA